jgi:hypothetical protein
LTNRIWNWFVLLWSCCKLRAGVGLSLDQFRLGVGRVGWILIGRAKRVEMGGPTSVLQERRGAGLIIPLLLLSLSLRQSGAGWRRRFPGSSSLFSPGPSHSLEPAMKRASSPAKSMVQEKMQPLPPCFFQAFSCCEAGSERGRLAGSTAVGRRFSLNGPNGDNIQRPFLVGSRIFSARRFRYQINNVVISPPFEPSGQSSRLAFSPQRAHPKTARPGCREQSR